MSHFLLFLALGLVTGAYGTLVGAGGSFLLVPLLIWLYPSESPELLAGVSLTVVFFNALSGSIAYGRLRRIHYPSGLIFSAAALPGAILGALSTAYLPRRLFDAVIGGLLVAASVYLFLRPRPRENANAETSRYARVVSMTDRDGGSHHFAFNPILGVALSFGIGYLSSILGIGGGIIHVPVLVHWLNFPVHIATATSHFILAVVALAGSLTHLYMGTLLRGLGDIIPLSIGVVVGAQFGARLSMRLHGGIIIRGLAVALFLVGLRTLWALLR